MNGTILISGATGTLGSEVVKQLSDESSNIQLEQPYIQWKMQRKLTFQV
jgi:FlaA1/EpsC-like NDP-sugar epimerase